MTNKSKLFYLLIITYAIIIQTIGTLLYSSSLPFIKKYFHATTHQTELTIITFILFSAISTLLYGPLSDKFGRKKILIAGMFIYCFSSFPCIWTKHITQLIALRGVQGIGLGCIFSFTTASIADIVGEGKILAKAYSLYEFFYGVSIITIPFMGGYIQEHFGWKGNFVFMGLAALILCLGCLFGFKETNKNKQNVNLKDLFINAYRMIKFKQHFSALLIMGFLSSYMYVFYAMGPFFVETKLHFSPLFFGTLSLWIGIVYMSSTLLNILLLNWLKSIKTVILCGLLLIGIACLLLSMSAKFGYLDIYFFIIPVCLINLGIGLVYANIHSIIISRYPDLAGSCNAQIDFLFSTIGMFMIIFATYFFKKIDLSLFVYIYIIITLIIIFLSFFAFNKELKTITTK